MQTQYNQSSSFQPSFQYQSTTSPTFNYNFNNYSQSYQLPQTFSNQMTKSRILERNKYAQNQPLYNPLRNAVAPTGQNLQSRQYQNMIAAQTSTLTHEYRPISLQQIGDIRNNTYMIEQPLKPTDHFEKVQGKHYFILDTHEKQGTPINQIQFKSRLEASRQKNIVIYQAQDSPQKKIEPLTVKKLAEQPVQTNQKVLNTPNKPRNLAKYNLYSCLDQPFERVKRYGCKNLTCPANQCVASKQKYDWYN